MKTILFSLAFTLTAFARYGEPPPGCEFDKECFIDAPGMKCADGTPSYFTITARKDAKNLLIFLKGGGACWNKSTCEKGLAKPLTRVVQNTDWNTGRGIFNRSEPKNPFRENYNIVTIPYCTGDVFTGNRSINYGTEEAPYVMQHFGYNNVVLALSNVKKYYPFPEKLALAGESAGGLGVLYHARSLDQFFPTSRKYVIDDSGVPFEPPYIAERRYLEVMKGWGADQTFPFGEVGPLKDHNFGTLIEMNKIALPYTHFGLIGAYSDVVMTYFALSIGSQSAFTSVRNALTHTVDKHIGDSQYNKVFYLNGNDHTYLHRDLGVVQSEGVTLGDWLTAMMEDQEASWVNVVPPVKDPLDEVDRTEFYQSLKEALPDLNLE